MPEEKPNPPPSQPSPLPPTPPIRNLELKAALLLAVMVLVVVASALYVMYARGAFDATQRLVLIADDSEGVFAGMDITFSGFPIGRVRSTELGKDGNVRINIDVPVNEAHWLRETSVFVLERSLVGSTRIRAFSGVLTDPALPDGAVRNVLRGDATAEIPKLMVSVRELLESLNAMAGADAPLRTSLANVQAVTEKLKGPNGALGVLFGNDADAKKLLQTLDRTNALLARLDGLTAKVNGLAAKADTQVFGDKGVMQDVKASTAQINAMLAEARTSLKKVDAILQNAQVISANAKDASTDLTSLRAEVESSLHKVESLINEVNRKWPFKRDMELKLP
jgi:phospholipid/cholesterol/gamma-HCH transport system substrate-binding protein